VSGQVVEIVVGELWYWPSAGLHPATQHSYRSRLEFRMLLEVDLSRDCRDEIECRSCHRHPRLL
jgi:hypothetical protein